MFDVRVRLVPLNMAAMLAEGPVYVRRQQKILMDKLQRTAAGYATSYAPHWRGKLAGAMFTKGEGSESIITPEYATVAPRPMGYGASYEGAQEDSGGGATWLPPWTHLLPWVESVLHQTGTEARTSAYFIAQGIEAHGIQSPHHFMEKAAMDLDMVVEAELISLVDMVAKSVIQL